MKKKIIAGLLTAAMALSLTACGSTATTTTETPASSDASSDAVSADAASSDATESGVAELADATIYIDIAASLEEVFKNEIIPEYESQHPNIHIEYNTGSSGTLLQGIEEANGSGHDLFFSAGKAQVTTLDEEDGMVKEGSIVNLISNQLCLVKGNDVETAVTGWDNISDAKSAAICAGSVPVGKYTRIALINLGLLDETDDPTTYTTDDISAALGGIEIDEADDVEVAAAKAAEGSVEVATIYYSDYYNHQDELTIIAQDDGTLTGDIIYPMCLVENPDADDAEVAAAADFASFLQTDFCLNAYEAYDFIVNK